MTQIHILAICASDVSLELPLKLVAHKTKIVTCTTEGAIDGILTLTSEELRVYSLIVLSPIFWRIHTTTPSIVKHFLRIFTGPIVAIVNHGDWRTLMTKAGCTYVLKNDESTARFIHNLLFPPETTT